MQIFGLISGKKGSPVKRKRTGSNEKIEKRKKLADLSVALPEKRKELAKAEEISGLSIAVFTACHLFQLSKLKTMSILFIVLLVVAIVLLVLILVAPTMLSQRALNIIILLLIIVILLNGSGLIKI